MTDYISFFSDTVGSSGIILSARSHIVVSMCKAMRMVCALRVVNNNVLSYLISKTFEQSGNRIKYFVKVHAQYFICGNVWHFLIKTTMNVNVMINHETRMPEPLDVV